MKGSGMGHCAWGEVFLAEGEDLRFLWMTGIIWEKAAKKSRTVMNHTVLPHAVINNRKKRNQWKTQWKIKQQKNGN